MANDDGTLQRLMQTIEDRKNNPSARSYTTKLMAGGTEAIGAKVIEEAAELVEAAGKSGAEGRDHLIHEAADLAFLPADLHDSLVQAWVLERILRDRVAALLPGQLIVH